MRSGGRAQTQSCAVLCVYVSEGVDEVQGYAIRDVFNELETLGWWFLNPGTFLAVMIPSDSARQIAVARTRLARMATEYPDWPTVNLGVSEDKVFGQVDDNGMFIGLPMGAAVVAAMALAQRPVDKT